MNFTPKVHHSSEIFFLCQDISWAEFIFCAQLTSLALGRCVWFLKPGIWWKQHCIIGEKMLRCRGAFWKKHRSWMIFLWHSQSPDLGLQSVQMHFTQKSYVKRNQEEIDECFYWRRSICKSSHANALLQVGHCLKDNQSCAVGIPCLGRGYGAVVVTMLMSRPLLEDLAMFRRDLFRNKPCNKPEMPGGSEWNCPKRRSSLCVGILEIMRVLII